MPTLCRKSILLKNPTEFKSEIFELASMQSASTLITEILKTAHLLFYQM